MKKISKLRTDEIEEGLDSEMKLEVSDYEDRMNRSIKESNREAKKEAKMEAKRHAEIKDEVRRLLDKVAS